MKQCQGSALSLSCACCAPPRLMAGMGVPSESPDAALLLAWLGRCTGAPSGLVLRLPAGAPAPVAAHVCHLLQRMLKAGPPLRHVLARCRGACTSGAHSAGPDPAPSARHTRRHRRGRLQTPAAHAQGRLALHHMPQGSGVKVQ